MGGGFKIKVGAQSHRAEREGGVSGPTRVSTAPVFSLSWPVKLGSPG